MEMGINLKPVNHQKSGLLTVESCGENVVTLLEQFFFTKTDGITGTIRSLIVDQTYEVETSYIPIDTLVSQITEGSGGDGFIMTNGGESDLVAV